MSSQSTAYPISASLRFPRLRACDLSRAQTEDSDPSASFPRTRVRVRCAPRPQCGSVVRARSNSSYYWQTPTGFHPAPFLISNSFRPGPTAPSSGQRRNCKYVMQTRATTLSLWGVFFLFDIYPQLVKCNRVQRPGHSIS